MKRFSVLLKAEIVICSTERKNTYSRYFFSVVKVLSFFLLECEMLMKRNVSIFEMLLASKQKSVGGKIESFNCGKNECRSSFEE